MFFSCLCSVCAWGTAALPFRRQRTPPIGPTTTTAADVTSSASTSLRSTVSTTDDESDVDINQDEAEQATSLQLDRYFCQQEEKLRELGRLYQKDKKNLIICKALATALNELGKPEENEACAEAIAKLEACTNTWQVAATAKTLFIPDSKKVLEFSEKYDDAIRQGRIISAVAADYEIKNAAPLTYLRLMGAYYRATGEGSKAEAAFDEYRELSKSLTAWVQELISEINKS